MKGEKGEKWEKEEKEEKEGGGVCFPELFSLIVLFKRMKPLSSGFPTLVLIFLLFYFILNLVNFSYSCKIFSFVYILKRVCLF